MIRNYNFLLLLVIFCHLTSGEIIEKNFRQMMEDAVRPECGTFESWYNCFKRFHILGEGPEYGIQRFFYFESWTGFIEEIELTFKDGDQEAKNYILNLIDSANIKIPPYFKHGFNPHGFLLDDTCKNYKYDVYPDTFIRIVRGQSEQTDYHKLWNHFKTEKLPVLMESFSLSICWCLRNNNELSCPNPCLDDPCSTLNHTREGSCKRIDDKYKFNYNEIHKKYRKEISRFYPYTYSCKCQKGYQWSEKIRSCVKTFGNCLDPKYGDKKHPCLNGGNCVSLPPPSQYDFRCECGPAWTGFLCELPKDPCLDTDGREICNIHTCIRDPFNSKYGLRCECIAGYSTMIGSDHPGCHNIDECLDNPCFNGGNCTDLSPVIDPFTRKPTIGYTCICRTGFDGDNCQFFDKKIIGWTPWTEWSPCSVYCGFGDQQRSRNCMIEEGCEGSNIETQNCIGERISCDEASTNKFGEVVYQSGTAIMEEWGFHDEDDYLLDDYSTWSVQQNIDFPWEYSDAYNSLNGIEKLVVKIADIYGIWNIPFIKRYYTDILITCIVGGIILFFFQITIIGVLLRKFFLRYKERRSLSSQNT